MKLENLINFDDVSAPEHFDQTKPLRDEYKIKGVTFEGPDTYEGGAVLSRQFNNQLGGSYPNALVIDDRDFYGYPNPAFAKGPETLKFIPPITYFKIKAYNYCEQNISMAAYDPDNILVDSLSIPPPFAGYVTRELKGDNISKIKVSAICTHIVLDDLYFRSWIRSSSDSGSIHPTESRTIKFTFNSANMKAGTYSMRLFIENNDPISEKRPLQVIMKVKANAGILTDKSNLNFGSCYVSGVSKQYINITNTGLDTLNINSLLSNSTSFKSEAERVSIPPRTSSTVEIDFKPISNVQYSGTLSLCYGLGGDVLKIPMTGIGLSKPQIIVNPDNYIVFLNPGDSLQGKLCISNAADTCTFNVKVSFNDSIEDYDWNYKGQNDKTNPLEYIPRVLVFNEDGQFISKYLNEFPLKVDWVSNIHNPDTISYEKYDLVIIADFIDAYGTLEKLKSYVQHGGIVFYALGNYYILSSFDIAGGVSVIPGKSESPNEIVARNHPAFFYCDRLLYNGNEIVNTYYFNNLSPDTKVLTRTFTTKLPTTIEYSLGNGLILATSLMIEYMQKMNTEGSRIVKNMIYYILSQNSNRWLRVKANNEKLNRMQTSCLPFSIKTAGLRQGEYAALIALQSTDVLIEEVPFVLKVQKIPRIKFQNEKVNFGYLKMGNEKVIDLFITNIGQQFLTIDNDIQSEVFSVLQYNLIIYPGQTKKISILFKPTQDLQYYHGNLLITTNDPMNPNFQVKIEGNTGGINGVKPQSINNIDVYPNPTDGMFYIKGEIYGLDDLEIKIYNSQGNEVAGRIIHDKADINEKFDLSNLPKGVYLIKLYSKQKISVFKVEMI
jgi:hypothetical protein